MLVLDDEKELVDIVVEELGEMGIKADGASKTPEAFELVKNGHYQIIICDIKMPAEDGLAFVKRLKKNINYNPIIVFFTGFSSYSKQELLDSGAHAVFSKPQDLPGLYQWVKNHLH